MWRSGEGSRANPVFRANKHSATPRNLNGGHHEETEDEGYMVMIITYCKCGSCNGGSKATSPYAKPGELVFGGSICNCPCHRLKGKELEDFIEYKKFIEADRKG